MEKTLETALQAINSGYSIIPIHKADPDLGDKRPAVNWKKYQTTKMGKEDAQKWFTNGEYAIAVLMGAASGGLLMIELEGRAAKYLPILTQTAHDSGLKTLWQKLFQWCEQTPSGGWHFYIKCAENSHGNRKLAKTSSGEVLAETRENGGYSVIAPADGTIFHHGGKGAWQQISGNPTTAATVTLEELDTLLDIFRSINQDVKPAPQPTLEASFPHRDNSGVTPGDDYENKTDWADILTPHGWARLHTDQSGTTYWRRPGKDTGISATTGNAKDRDRLYVFSTSTIFEPETAYTKFAAYTILNHNGDYREAAKKLSQTGYGKPAEHHRDPAIIDLDQWATSKQNDTVVEPTTYSRSDDGNALRYADTYTGMLRYIPEKDTWTVWNRHVWDSTDGTAVAIQKGRQLARALPEDNKLDKTHKKRSCNAGSIKNMLYLARHSETMYTPLTSFDANPYQLNTPKGVYDLKTGKLSAPTAKTLCLRTTSIAPDKTMPTPLWNRFIDETFLADGALITYVQRLLGQTLIGTPLEQILPFFHGSGANGKTTLLNVILHILGTGETGYSIISPASILTNTTGVPVDVAALAGTRLAVITELEEGTRIAEAKAKMLTGADIITARFMHQNYFTFHPTHHLIILTNATPETATGGTPALWRRIKKIPFLNIVPKNKRDPYLEQKLLKEAPGILAWLLEGTRLYLEDGLAEPESVRIATADYEREQNTVAQFVTEACTLHEVNQNLFNIRVPELRSKYEQWCRINGLDPVGSRALGNQLKRLGIESAAAHGYRYYSGISFKAGLETDLNGVL